MVGVEWNCCHCQGFAEIVVVTRCSGQDDSYWLLSS